ncbi:uncharacterized protein LOC117299673 [Asterias rubens]|uniref:uncharacterized protein LOC117299673 n=1 Tax=Asterias rubens TaxID=7604 RepID=UPI001455D237|nr:uncharacterized protein LOC117299673 [Asterias rubens]
MASNTTQKTVPKQESETSSDMPPINEVTLRKLAENLPNWEQVASYLKITNIRVGRLKAECPGNIDEQIFQMLHIWYRRFNLAANRHQMGEELIDALKQVDGTEDLIACYLSGNMK